MATLENYPARLVTGGDFFVQIDSGETVSTELDVFGASILGFVFTQSLIAATLTFEVSIDGRNFYQLTDGYSGNPIQIVATASKIARIQPIDFICVQALRIVSSVAQAADVQIEIIAGPVL